MEKINVETLFDTDQLDLPQVKKFLESSECWVNEKQFVVGPKDSYKHIAVSVVDNGDEISVGIFKTTVVELVEAIRHRDLTSTTWFAENKPTVFSIKKHVTAGGAIMWAFGEYKKSEE